MYGEHRKSAQGRWLAAIERLAPAAAANRLGDLSEKNVPFWRLIENTVRVLLFLMFIQTRRAFDVRLFLGEACLIYLAFLGSALSGAIVLMLPTLAFLRLRDAYIDLAEGFPQDTVKDCFLTAAFMVVFEKVLLASAAPAYALGGDVLYRGIVGATVMLAAWRVIFRTRQAPEDPERRKMRQSYRSVARMTWVWLYGVLFLVVFADMRGIPDFPGLDFLRGFMAPVLLLLAYRLQKEFPLGWRVEQQLIRFSEDPYRQDLVRWSNSLWVTDPKKSPGVPWWIIPEALFFVVLAIPLLGPIFGLLSGRVSPAETDWLNLAAHAAALAAMTGLWIYIKKLNVETAKALDEAARALKMPESR